MASYLNSCVWKPTAGGTGTWTVSAGFGVYKTPAQCSSPAVANGATYNYFAILGNEYERGTSTYTVSGTTATRTVIESSNANAAVNFASPPIVFYGVPFAGDVGPEAGRQAIDIESSAMVARTTNGPALATSTESTTNKVMQEGYDFDQSTIEYVQFRWRMPKQWDVGTVTFVPIWSHGSTATNFKVSWGLQAVAISDDDALDAAFGTAQYSNDTGGTTRDCYIGPESSAITIGGTPAAGDYVVFQVFRKADDATNDTLAIDARLHGIVLFITTTAGNDA